MPEHRHFEPGEKAPSSWANALQEFVASASLMLRVKPGQANALQVPAGPGDDQVAVAIEGRWRYVTGPVEHAGAGTARTVDVFVTASDNVFSTVAGAEVDETDYSFDLAIVDEDATPSGVDLSRRIGSAVWNGSRFTDVARWIGGVLVPVAQPAGSIVATVRADAPLGWLLLSGAGAELTR